MIRERGEIRLIHPR